MNVGLIILAQHEHDGAGAAQLRRSNDSVAAAAPSQQHYNLELKCKWCLIVASLLEVLPAARNWQHLEEG